MVVIDKLIVMKESLKIIERNRLEISIQSAGGIFEFIIKTFKYMEV